jgi:hypothetical protein
MPSMRKLEVEEVQKFEKPTESGMRAAIAREYDEYLSDFAPGDWGRADLQEGENKTTVRNRLKAAASRRMWALEFKRTRDDSILFRVVGSRDDDTTVVFAPVVEDEELELVA